MDIVLFCVLIFFSLVLLVTGFFRNQIVLIVFAALSFILLGLFSLNGIDYVSSSTMVTNGITTTLTNNYSTWNHSFGSSGITVGYALGFLFVLFGLFLLLVAGVMLFDKKKKISFDDADDGGA